MTSGLEGAPGGDEARLEAALAASRLERDRTLVAMHQLDAALTMASGAENWQERVTRALQRLESSMREEWRELLRPDALLAMAAATNPRRFDPRIRSLRERYDDLIRRVRSLHGEIDGEDAPGANELRRHAGEILRNLHHCRARQADVVFEALDLELGTS